MGKLYAASDAHRLVSQPSDEDPSSEPYRSPYRRDYGRLIHCPAFRRLQGKLQLFPGPDSDFFRTRLSHSLEVAQIAKSIAIRLNATHPKFKSDPIDTDLVETAALAHDLGHPPFGHNGEYALDECMAEYGGFEGNAQTLRILSRLEKRQTGTTDDEGGPIPVRGGKDVRAGLNLTVRTLAAVLKYDEEIPPETKDRTEPGIFKGYYQTETPIVKKIKREIPHHRGRFRTIECSIMDVADDIAYSTYDLEDAFKAEFLTPLSVLSQPFEFMEPVAARVKFRIDQHYPHLKSSQRAFDFEDVFYVLFTIFGGILGASAELINHGDPKEALLTSALAARATFSASANLVRDGYRRAKLTSDLVGSFIQNVEVDYDDQYPSQSQAYLNLETFKQVEVLKTITYQSLIMSPRLKVGEHRGKQIIKDIFDALVKDDGHLLMPDDLRSIHKAIKYTSNKRRVICDFIACMTDRYALDFYSRLFGTSHASIYDPL